MLNSDSLKGENLDGRILEQLDPQVVSWYSDKENKLSCTHTVVLIRPIMVLP